MLKISAVKGNRDSVTYLPNWSSEVGGNLYLEQHSQLGYLTARRLASHKAEKHPFQQRSA